MVQVTEAVFSQGVLKPVDRLQLQEQQRVRLIIEPVSGSQLVGAGIEARVARLYSEDPPGQTIETLEIVNPFA